MTRAVAIIRMAIKACAYVFFAITGLTVLASILVGGWAGLNPGPNPATGDTAYVVVYGRLGHTSGYTTPWAAAIYNVLLDSMMIGLAAILTLSLAVIAIATVVRKIRDWRDDRIHPPGTRMPDDMRGPV